jgi:hypothetical protein
MDEDYSDDHDRDGYSNGREFERGSDPTDHNDPEEIYDFDYDDLPDHWETTYFGDLGEDPYDDYDGDDLTNLDEYYLGSDPTDYFDPGFSGDADFDGLPDQWERMYFDGLYQSGHDDYDWDGYNEYEEYEGGTDPTDPYDYPHQEPNGHDYPILWFIFTIVMMVLIMLVFGGVIYFLIFRIDRVKPYPHEIEDK